MKFSIDVRQSDIEHAIFTQDCAIYCAVMKATKSDYVSVSLDYIDIEHNRYKCDAEIREWQKHLLIASGRHTQLQPPKPITILFDTNKYFANIEVNDDV